MRVLVRLGYTAVNDNTITLHRVSLMHVLVCRRHNAVNDLMHDLGCLGYNAVNDNAITQHRVSLTRALVCLRRIALDTEARTQNRKLLA